MGDLAHSASGLAYPAAAAAKRLPVKEGRRMELRHVWVADAPTPDFYFGSEVSGSGYARKPLTANDMNSPPSYDFSGDEVKHRISMRMQFRVVGPADMSVLKGVTS